MQSLKRLLSEIGEDNTTINYGKVYISGKAKSGANLTTATKNDVVQVLKLFS